MRAIAVRFTDKSAKPSDAEEHRVLNTLKVLYQGGSLDGKTADFPTRDVSSVVFGLHRRNQHLFETYKRTICLNVRSGRTIFRWDGLTSKSNNSRATITIAQAGAFVSKTGGICYGQWEHKIKSWLFSRLDKNHGQHLVAP
jgi:hypothetical protein